MNAKALLITSSHLLAKGFAQELLVYGVGLEVAERLPEAFDGEIFAVEELGDGVHCLPKETSLEEEKRAIQTLLDGLYGPSHERVLIEGLNEREEEILLQILAGASNREIASSLFLSEKTIKNNITILYQKLEVSNRAEVFARFSFLEG